MLQRASSVLNSWFKVGQGMNNNSHVISMKHACGAFFLNYQEPPQHCLLELSRLHRSK